MADFGVGLLHYQAGFRHRLAKFVAGSDCLPVEHQTGIRHRLEYLWRNLINAGSGFCNLLELGWFIDDFRSRQRSGTALIIAGTFRKTLTS